MLGKVVREWRTRRGWTQRQLADKAGLTAAMISMTEANKRGSQPTANTYLAFSKAFGVTLEEFDAAVKGQEQDS